MALAGGIGRGWERIRELPDRTPLRVKLITAVLALVAIALVVISIVGISALSRDLLGQADEQIGTLYTQAQTGRHLYSSAIGPEAWVYEGLTSNGPPQVVGGNVPQSTTLPDLSSASIAWLTSNPGRPMTVPGASGSNWRVVAYPGFPFVQTSNGTPVTGTLFVALDVSGAYRTIGQLVAIDLIVSALLLLLLLVAGIAVVRASLRPLTDIEKTAEAIAAGDLTRRVPEGDPRTEMGRLGGSLNAMLAQIETAFDARAQSELAARRSEERMRQFVADASHELRTPLTTIRASAEYYRQRGGLEETSGGGPTRRALGNGVDADAAARQANADPAGPGAGPLARPELNQIMQRVEQESSRMGVLVEDMLLLARLDQQRPLERRTVDMLTLAADAVHDARLVAPDRSIDLTVGAGSALLVMGDEVRIRQVIGNLMSNALTHTPDGTAIMVRVRSGSLDEWRTATTGAGTTVVAAAGADAPSSPAVIFEIADQGPGLTPYQAEHVFERFFRVDQARTRKSGGTGLGLAIVSALAAAHGGTVWVESPPGGGATFRVAIPLAPEARHIEPEPADGTDPDVISSHRALGPGAGTQPGPGAQSFPGVGTQS